MDTQIEVKVTATSLYVNVKAGCDYPWSLKMPTIAELQAFVPAGKAMQLLNDDGKMFNDDKSSKPPRCVTRFNLVSAKDQEVLRAKSDIETVFAEHVEEIHNEWMQVDLQSYIAEHYERTGHSAGAKKGFINGVLVGATIAVGAYFIYRGSNAA